MNVICLGLGRYFAAQTFQSLRGSSSQTWNDERNETVGPNPFLGVFYHWLGGLSSATCYLPFRRIKQWAWETYWLSQGIFSWIIAPIAIGMAFVPDVLGILHRAPSRSIAYAYIWGFLWGFGGLTFGLAVRFLGIALGYAIALGLCTAFGTLMPPLFAGEIGTIAHEQSGQVILFGIAVCMAGIAISGVAGMSKEKELSAEQKRKSVKEFNFLKGLMVAIFAGVMSACFAYGLQAGKPIAGLAKDYLTQTGRADLWQNLPVLVVVLLGGFTSNFIWCVVLLWKNKTAPQFFGLPPGKPSKEEDAGAPMGARLEPRTLLLNYLLSASTGLMWYFQFFFYSMGQTRMGKYDFSSWTLHMASIIIFSTIWGVLLKEWKGTSLRTRVLVGVGLVTLVLSTVIVGYGNFLKAQAGG
jgi:L-rhamnose-H+ transport protein